MDDFQVFVKPVGASCNLACTYCYYLEKCELFAGSGLHRMADDLLETYIIQHIEASAEPTILFSWHGGEPTLAGLDYFRRITEIQEKHLSANRVALNGIQTNGTLLSEEWCKFLKKENFIVGISLDGPEKFHSINRLKRDGQSSFDAVVRGYQLLKYYEIPCEILCVVNSVNVNFPLEVYRFFKSINAEFITFLPLVEKQTSGEKIVSERTVPAKAFGVFLCAIFDEWKTSDIGTVKIQIFEEALRTAFGLEHSLCIFKPVCGRVPVIERNGDFYPCDHFVDPVHHIGNIRQKSLSEMLECPAQKEFGLSKFNTLPELCLNCEVLNFCNGACPKDRFNETPEGESGLNYLCEGYKLFFNHCKPFVEDVAEVWRGESQAPLQPLP
jgi:uncharacterized protein